MKNLIKKGKKIRVEGRFIPESKLDDVSSNNLDFGYPQMGFDGTISIVLDNTCIVEFNDFEMEIPNEDLLFSTKTSGQ